MKLRLYFEKLGSQAYKTVEPMVERLHGSAIQKLFKAIENGRKSKVRHLIKEADVNLTNDNGDTPLIHAARNCRDVSILQILLNAKADAKKANNRGETPLMAAAERGNERSVNVLICHIRNNAIRSEFKPKLKSRQERLELIRRFREDKKCDTVAEFINQTDNNGETALVKAIRNGKLGVFKLLISCGADLDIKTSDGNTLLMVAVQNKRNKIANVLLEKGADIEARNDYGESVFTIAEKNDDMGLWKTMARKRR
ncbi:ankyrin repeat domain-containing protein [Candidatus Micrarchaeota archaeon]|nr:ankyrin repeat domain-containing protein [Candidatus Micrarchaeota archaeon]